MHAILCNHKHVHVPWTPFLSPLAIVHAIERCIFFVPWNGLLLVNDLPYSPQMKIIMCANVSKHSFQEFGVIQKNDLTAAWQFCQLTFSVIGDVAWSPTTATASAQYLSGLTWTAFAFSGFFSDVVVGTNISVSIFFLLLVYSYLFSLLPIPIRPLLTEGPLSHLSTLNIFYVLGNIQ